MPLTASRAQVIRMLKAVVGAKRGPASARTLTLALLGLTLVLGVIAALSVGDLLDARQRYEDALARSYQLEACRRGCLAVGVLEEQVLGRTERAARARRRRARQSFDGEAQARARWRAATPRAPAGPRAGGLAGARPRRRAWRRCPARRARAARRALLTARADNPTLTARQEERRARGARRTREETRDVADRRRRRRAGSRCSARWR